jgi:hypothetical protein
VHDREDITQQIRVLYYMRASTADWPMFQRATGRTVTDRDIAEAEYVWTFGGDPPAGEVRPESATARQWHDELADEWPNIEALAQALLAKRGGLPRPPATRPMRRFARVASDNGISG